MPDRRKRSLFLISITIILLALAPVIASPTPAHAVARATHVKLEVFRTAYAATLRTVKTLQTKETVQRTVEDLINRHVAVNVPAANRYTLLKNGKIFNALYNTFVMYLPPCKLVHSDPTVVKNLRNHLRFTFSDRVISLPLPFFRGNEPTLTSKINVEKYPETLHGTLEVLKVLLQNSFFPRSDGKTWRPELLAVDLTKLEEYLIRIVQIIYESEAYNTFHIPLDVLFRKHLAALAIATNEKGTHAKNAETRGQRVKQRKLPKAAEEKSGNLKKKAENLLKAINLVMNWIADYVTLDHKLLILWPIRKSTEK